MFFQYKLLVLVSTFSLLLLNGCEDSSGLPEYTYVEISSSSSAQTVFNSLEELQQIDTCNIFKTEKTVYLADMKTSYTCVIYEDLHSNKKLLWIRSYPSFEMLELEPCNESENGKIALIETYRVIGDKSYKFYTSNMCMKNAANSWNWTLIMYSSYKYDQMACNDGFEFIRAISNTNRIAYFTYDSVFAVCLDKGTYIWEKMSPSPGQIEKSSSSEVPKSSAENSVDIPPTPAYKLSSSSSFVIKSSSSSQTVKSSSKGDRMFYLPTLIPACASASLGNARFIECKSPNAIDCLKKINGCNFAAVEYCGCWESEDAYIYYRDKP